MSDLDFSDDDFKIIPEPKKETIKPESTRGNLVCENGEKDAKVVFEEHNDGRWNLTKQDQGNVITPCQEAVFFKERLDKEKIKMTTMANAINYSPQRIFDIFSGRSPKMSSKLRRSIMQYLRIDESEMPKP